VLRARANAPALVALDESLESIAERGVSEEQRLDRRLALERLYTLIQRLRPLDRQVMLLYLEQLLSPANVATKVRRIKQILVQRFHEGVRDGE
jgi:RNA polymerase sigma-70 factor (ECF subfamily)